MAGISTEKQPPLPVTFRASNRKDQAIISFILRSCRYSPKPLARIFSVACRGFQVVGCYSLRDNQKSLLIDSIAVHHGYQRRQIGTQIVGNILEDAFFYGFKTVDLYIHERNLAGQLFFRACGFTATPNIVRNAYKEDSAFHMTLSLESLSEGQDLHTMLHSHAFG